MTLTNKRTTITFSHINYYLDMSGEMQAQGIRENHIQLLCDVSSVFKPGVLTALVGVNGTEKTTLMDVQAVGTKTLARLRISPSLIEAHSQGSNYKQETL